MRNLLLRAHEDHDITGPDFLGLDMKERGSILEEVLADNPSDPALNFLAARFYHATSNDERAARILQGLLSVDINRMTNYHPPEIELYAAVLEKSGQDPRTLARLREILAQRKR